MQRVMMFGCLALGMATGCTSTKTTSASAPPEPVPAAPAPPSAALPASPIQVPPAKAAAATPPATVDGPSAAAAAPALPKKPKQPVATVPLKMAAGGSPSAPVHAPAATQPTLDLASLQQRLRETHAIGVFTKLSLKNEVDDLLDEFRDLYKQPNTRPTPQMRQHFDLLLLKVLTLLQDGDPPLAAAISSSKEAIWGILADPEKFAKI